MSRHTERWTGWWWRWWWCEEEKTKKRRKLSPWLIIDKKFFWRRLSRRRNSRSTSDSLFAAAFFSFQLNLIGSRFFSLLICKVMIYIIAAYHDERKRITGAYRVFITLQRFSTQMKLIRVAIDLFCKHTSDFSRSWQNYLLGFSTFDYIHENDRKAIKCCCWARWRDEGRPVFLFLFSISIIRHWKL